MKIKDLISKDESEQIKKMITDYGKNNEFEISFFSNKETSSNLLTLERFNHLNSVLHIITSKNESKSIPKNITVNTLDMIFGIKNHTTDDNKLINYRIQINGIDKINEYLKPHHKRKNHLVYGVLSSFINEDKDPAITIQKKTKNISSYITLEDIYMRVKMDKEEDVTLPELHKLQNIKKHWELNDYEIIYRFKERTTFFIQKDKNIYKIDLTNVRTSTQINNIDKSPIKYEIEVECDIKTKSQVFDQIFDIGEFIIKVIQQSNTIITKSLSNQVLSKYRAILGTDSSRTHLYGRQPISLEIQFVVDYIPNRYAVTDKADGDRYFMIVHDSHCYLISSNLIVKDTGIKVSPKYNNSILDGEYIFLPKLNKYLYMAFDCLVLSETNIRDENMFMKRIQRADELIYEINKTNYKHKYASNEKIDFNDTDKILQYHTKNITEFYKDINTELASNKSSIIFRRKYFIEANGIKDNEIFKYANLMWNLYTTDTNILCPYLLDGLIFQPLDQRYIVEAEKTKYFEFKWKPPHHNSIDFYIEFEKDKKTNKIITVYDNSVLDVVKNKPYQICNLHVGLVNKGIEKPVLFNKTENVSQCYIYLDSTGIPRTTDGKQINDKTVVEFYYNTSIDALNPYKWVPMKTRFDKTESVQKYGKRFGNYYDTAMKVWRSIMNPVLMSDFTELANDSLYDKYYKELKNRINFSLAKVDKQQNIYYQKKTRLVKDMGSFNNWVKSNVIYTYINPLYGTDNIQYKVLDIGCGRGGDIMKFYYTLVEMLVGIDPDLEGLISGTDCAVSRYQNQKKTHDNFPPMFFINANPANLLQYDEQLKIIGRMNQDNKKLFERFFTYDDQRTIFDRFNCSFAIHYLLSDINSWDNFCKNINMYLRDGGYLTFVTFDGDLIRKALTGKDKITQYYDDNGEKKILFEIVKKYDDKSKEKVGLPIDVHMTWVSEDGVYNTEYLVFQDFIIKSLKENCNMELVETGLFEDIFNDFRSFLELGIKEEEDIRTIKFFSDIYKFYEPNDINIKCYEYSFFNRFYVFRKIESDLAATKTKYYTSTNKKSLPSKIANKSKKKT
ncbi:MAG: mRNA capping enzyme [Gaeavirus sp.]|uniref:mRNA capping enzyme n=1 Tax=Gaeavirus sp. TaxID=2487767 RepID=A0A3G4ZYJ3_9VIRU|nr:MAG: mRNA capping enzyme [Gaeavirus sp.]